MIANGQSCCHWDDDEGGSHVHEAICGLVNFVAQKNVKLRLFIVTVL